MKFDNISGDEYFMSIALLSSLRSKDGNTKVGACIVSDDHKVLSLGYNGMPLGVSDEEIPWAGSKENKPYLETKYPYVCHAELNAMLNSGGSNLEGCKVYVALFPCNECAKAIIQSGIKEVIYISDKYRNTDSVRASKRMFDAAGVKYTKLEMKRDKLVIDFSENSI